MARTDKLDKRHMHKSQLVITLFRERAGSHHLDLPDVLTPATKVDSRTCMPVVARAFKLSGFDVVGPAMRISEIAAAIPDSHVENYHAPRARVF